MSGNRMRWFRRIAVVLAVFVAIGLALRNYATPLQRNNVAVPVYTVGDANYATALSEGKNVVKFGRLLFGIYPGGLAFNNPGDAREYLRRIDKEADWGVYQLSGDFELDTIAVNGKRYTNRSLLVIGGVGKNEESGQSNAGGNQLFWK